MLGVIMAVFFGEGCLNLGKGKEQKNFNQQ
jgi:hypothetical protein